MTNYLLDTADKRFADHVWDARDVFSCAPCVELKPGANLDVFAGECRLWFENAPDKPKAIHLMRTGCGFMPAHETWTDPADGVMYQGTWGGPVTVGQYREQLLGGFNRLGSDAVWFDEVARRIDDLPTKVTLDFVYQSFECQGQPFERPNGHPWWRYIDGLTGDKRLPRNLRYTTAYGLKKITSLAAWLQTRTPYVRKCWYDWYMPLQWGQMRACWEQSRLGFVPVCSWNQPNYSWSDPATWDGLWLQQIGRTPHLPMYDSTPEWLAKYRAILEYTHGDCVAHVRPDLPFTDQLKLIDEYDVACALIFCDPTRLSEWKAGIRPMLDQIRAMREE